MKNITRKAGDRSQHIRIGGNDMDTEIVGLQDLVNVIYKQGYNKALDDIESEFLKCEKVHYNLQDILCVINKLKAGDRE